MTDKQFTRFVPSVALAQTGDIIGLTRMEQTDPRFVHVGVVSKDDQGDLLLVHNARHEGVVRTQLLADVLLHDLHEIIAWIKRPMIRNLARLNPDFLRRYHLEHLLTRE